jgi:hypothetical protein
LKIRQAHFALDGEAVVLGIKYRPMVEIGLKGGGL